MLKAMGNILSGKKKALLIEEAKVGNLAGVRRILSKSGKSPDERDENGLTPLMWAANEGYLTIAEMLIENGADISARDVQSGMTALYCAAHFSRIPIIEFLLEKGADINVQDMYGWTALMDACKRGDTTVVDLLLERGADWEIKNSTGWNALMWAAEKGRVPVIVKLLNKGAIIDMSAKSLLSDLLKTAARNAELRAVLQIRFTSTDGLLDECMHFAARSGIDRFTTLIKLGYVNYRDKVSGDTPLLAAIKNRNTPLLLLLLEQGADVNMANNKGVTALQLASDAGDSDLMQLLERNGAAGACSTAHGKVTSGTSSGTSSPGLVRDDSTFSGLTEEIQSDESSKEESARVSMKLHSVTLKQ